MDFRVAVRKGEIGAAAVMRAGWNISELGISTRITTDWMKHGVVNTIRMLIQGYKSHCRAGFDQLRYLRDAFAIVRAIWDL